MEEIIKTLLLEGIDESMIHRVLDVIEEEYEIIDELKDETVNRAYATRVIRDKMANRDLIHGDPGYNDELGYKRMKSSDLMRDKLTRKYVKNKLSKLPKDITVQQYNRAKEDAEKRGSYLSGTRRGKAFKQGLDSLAKEGNPEALSYIKKSKSKDK